MDIEQRLICPDCSEKLSKSESEQLRCPSCGRTFHIQGRLINLLPTRLKKEDFAEEEFWKTDLKEGLEAEPNLAIRAKEPEISFTLEKILPNLKLTGTILEIGSGACWLSALTKKAFPDTFVVASDVSVAALNKGQQVVAHFRTQIDRYVACKAENLPFEDEVFDYVIGSAVLHHTELPKALAQIFRVLKEGGRLIGTGEPVIPRALGLLWKSGLVSGGRRQKELGVKEGSYSLSQWREYFHRTRFRQAEFIPRMHPQYKKASAVLRAYYHLTCNIPTIAVLSFFPCVVLIAASK